MTQALPKSITDMLGAVDGLSAVTVEQANQHLRLAREVVLQATSVIAELTAERDALNDRMRRLENICHMAGAALGGDVLTDKEKIEAALRFLRMEVFV